MDKLESWPVIVRNAAVKADISKCPTYNELHTKCIVLTALYVVLVLTARATLHYNYRIFSNLIRTLFTVSEG